MGAAILVAWNISLRAQEVSEGQRHSIPVYIDSPATGRTHMVLRWTLPMAAPAYRSTTIYRRSFPPTARGWGEPLAVLPPEETTFHDVTTPAPIGSAGVEYRLVAVERANGQCAYGYVIPANSAPAELDPRKAALVVIPALVETNMLVAVLAHMDGLQAEGWSVFLMKVPPDAAPAAIRGEIQKHASTLANAGTPLRSLLLVGRVPVPYSGNLAPDGHRDHWGAWPTDLYYADLDGAWTDDRVSTTQALDPRQHNIPGDGKLDQNELPGAVELSVGRVDFTPLGGLTPADQTARVRDWFKRVRAWRRGATSPPTSAPVLLQDLMADNPEAFSATAWRLAPLLGGTGLPHQQPLLAGAGMGASSTLFAFGYSPGTFTAAHDIATTADLLQQPLPAPFVFLFGSYFGDWDAPDNLLAATLAGPAGTRALASAWAARPPWQLHPMAAGYTVGECQMLTANRTPDYLPGLREAHPIHLALMGDPTLHLYPLPPTPKPAVSHPADGARLKWSPPVASGSFPHLLSASPLGWHIYAWKDGVPTRLTKEALPPHQMEWALPPDRLKTAEYLQVRQLYQLETAVGTLQRLGPGELTAPK